MLVLPVELATELRARCEAAWPREACGLLLGEDRGGRRTAIFLQATINGARHAPERAFSIGPAELLAADDLAHARGLVILGTWHSHPGAPCRPSVEDHAGAQPGWSHLIVSLAEGRATEVRSFVLADGLLGEEPLGG